MFNYANQMREHFFKTREKTTNLKRLKDTEFQIIDSKDLLSDELYHKISVGPLTDLQRTFIA